MTTERAPETNEDYETPPAGLPLFTQPVPPVAEHRDIARPLVPQFDLHRDTGIDGARGAAQPDDAPQ